MPGQNHHAAPKFNGRPASLSIFLDEIEQLAGACKLSEKQTIDWTIRYAPNEERELWQLQDAVTSSIWADFNKELFDLYPGSTGERKYSVASLTSLVEDQAQDLGAYRRWFLTIAAFLRNKSRLTDREISGYFMQGMEPVFRTEVQSQLRAENPRHHTDDPYTLAEIFSAALFILTSKDIEELRAVDAIIEGCEVEATIDDGSQILSIREDIWHKTGLPLRADITIVMESANLTKDKTMGLIKNLKLTIGGYDFYVQAQVVKDAPYEVLLGRPFFTLTQASHQHYSNGDSRLTVLDPNTQELITIPTRPQTRKNVMQGF
ncbi:hypothetical protein BYT27DRAFT_7220648 [Phlegmacium glaucopus]|nr:hypothetical protein BYT27DRAFT_7221964 [Phlegmacium glaucopus]KAF8813047.1 hypothetical protein BYT27DRAFT_7220648 [Phlegmacium glaucopus]